MASSDLNVRFTDEKYASKSEVMKELGTSLVDNIWANILAYRRSKHIKTTLRCIDSSELVLYKGEGIDAIVSSFEEKLSSLNANSSAMMISYLSNLNSILSRMSYPIYQVSINKRKAKPYHADS